MSEAFERAVAEGLSYFWAHMNAGHTVSFVGSSWEDGGFFTRDTEPVRDSKRNTVANFRCEVLDPDNQAHVAQCEEWFGN